MKTSVPKSLIGVVIYLLILDAVTARPCYEGADFEPCFLSKIINDDVMYAAFSNEQFSRDQADEGTRQKYEIKGRGRETRDSHEEDLKHCIGCEETDVVDREDHVTQYLSELLVNTDSEITGLQGSDVEEVQENSGSFSGEDGYFAFLTGAEKISEVDGIVSKPLKTIVDEIEFAS